MRRAPALAVLLAAVAAAPASAATRDTTRVVTSWMVTASGTQEVTWTADATKPPPSCAGEDLAPTRSVTGHGSFSLPFSTPRAYRFATVQVFKRASNRRSQRTLSYRPRGAPKLDEHMRVPVTPTIDGTFTDAVQGCNTFDTSMRTAPTSGCGSRATTLDLVVGFGLVSSTRRDRPNLIGTLVKPWFVDADRRLTCPTFGSAALTLFDEGHDTPACPSATTLDTPAGPPETGLATDFHPGKFWPRLTSANPKTFTLTTSKTLDCTLTATQGSFPLMRPDGTLRITGALRYTWTFTPKRVTGKAARPQAL